MKILLVACNAKYIHSNLAVYCLRAYAKERYPESEIAIAEYTINQPFDEILTDLYRRNPDVLCLSCYLWNITEVGQILRETAKILPKTAIWLGGPEVSYNAREVLENYPMVQGIMKGEGEESFTELVAYYGKLKERKQLRDIEGLMFRDENGEIIETENRPILDLSTVPFVYEHIEDFQNRIIYYESSRGCPFSCSYCLSSIDKCLRFRKIELVKKELQFFIDHEVPQVKFVDRTFNCKHDHAMAIWKYITEHDKGITNFHFEVAADLLNEEEIELIRRMRPGLIQLEIGIQSANPKTIREIHRTMDLKKVRAKVERIREKGNVLAVQVHKMSTAAFLEDQDFFRFFGIFRNVTLKAVPEVHLEDVWFQPTLNKDNISGRVSVKMKVSAPEGKKVSAHLVLKDRENNQVAEDNITLEEKAGSLVGVIDTEVGSVKAWDNHCPYLYHAYVELRGEAGEILEIIPYDIGFRRLEMIDKVIYLNGKRLVITGVNRHEWSAKTGRSISMDEMTADIDCMIRNNINAVRTCHYPDQIPWYYLCDKAGIYVMAETNMESHGTFQKLGAIEPSCSVPCSIPQWREAVVDRARSNFETFKNHTAILFWSLGNESYAGDDIEAMNTYFKEKQDGRFVHYESSFYDRNYEETISDVESRMYAKPYEVEEYLNNNPKKPYLLCEYMHDMGNSMGGLGTYMKLIDKYEMYHGGFIWDFIDQALLVKDEVTGKEVLRYGGDFDDKPSDYEFSGNGIVFADRKEKPAMQEVRYYYGLYR